jgi:transposase, IS30 family
MGKQYNRLSLEEREEISRMLAMGAGIRSIGKQIGRHASTISREVHPSKDPRWRHHYRATTAHWRARRNSRSRHWGKRKLLVNRELAKVIQEKIELYWSPQQIAQWLKQTYEDKSMQVSAETIYTYIYVLGRGELKKTLLKGLRQKHKRRWKRNRVTHVQKNRRCELENMLSIEERPKEVENRIIPGHWEGDLIIGGRTEQSALGTLVERTTRTILLVPLKTKKAREVRKAFAAKIKRLPQHMRLSLTYDQGREMAEHTLFTKETKMKVYFAHPKSPWERGTNENTNGLIRQFFPKGTNFRNVSRKEINRAQHLLNGRPRKVLNWKTPYDAMQLLLR